MDNFMHLVYSVKRQYYDRLITFEIYRNDNDIYFSSEDGEEDASPIKYMDDIDWLLTKFLGNEDGVQYWLYDILQQTEAYSLDSDSVYSNDPIRSYESRQHTIQSRQEEEEYEKLLENGRV
jgi:hypothetical protein